MSVQLSGRCFEERGRPLFLVRRQGWCFCGRHLQRGERTRSRVRIVVFSCAEFEGLIIISIVGRIEKNRGRIKVHQLTCSDDAVSSFRKDFYQ